MSAGDLCREVQQYVYDWVPRRAYESEGGFRSDLQAYLDTRLHGDEDPVADRTRDVSLRPGAESAGSDVIVDGSVGIELELDVTRAAVERLQEQLPSEASDYRCVVIVVCGVGEADEWQALERDHDTAADGDGPGPAVHVIHKRTDRLESDSEWPGEWEPIDDGEAGEF